MHTKTTTVHQRDTRPITDIDISQTPVNATEDRLAMSRLDPPTKRGSRCELTGFEPDPGRNAALFDAKTYLR